MSEKKTTLPSLRKLDLEKVKAETETIKKLLPNIRRDNITELNKRIYVGGKLVCDKTNVPQRNPNRNT